MPGDQRMGHPIITKTEQLVANDSDGSSCNISCLCGAYFK
jgi:hypothetical protein